MKLVPVSPEEFPDLREGRRGRVSYPLLKTFLETGERLVMLDRTGMQQSLQSLTSSLGGYIRSHNLPIKLITRSGQIYLARTDMDEDGNVQKLSIDTFKRDTGQTYSAPPVGARPIDSVEVAQRFATEKEKGAK